MGAVANAAVLYDNYGMGWGRVAGDTVEFHPLAIANKPERLNVRVPALVGWFPDALWMWLARAIGDEFVQLSSSGFGEHLVFAFDNFGGVKALPGLKGGSLAMLRASYDDSQAILSEGLSKIEFADWHWRDITYRRKPRRCHASAAATV